MTKKEKSKIINQWIIKIKEEGKYSPLSKEAFLDEKTVKVTPYNFYDIYGGRIILVSKGIKYYIKISGKTSVDYFEDENNITTKIYSVKNSTVTRFGIRLSNPKNIKKTVLKEKEEVIEDKHNPIKQIQAVVDNWIDNLNENNLKQELEMESIPENRSVKISPYNYSHREGNKIFLNIKGSIQIYRPIFGIPAFNTSLVRDIEEKNERKFFIQKLSAKNSYKLTSFKSNAAQDFLTQEMETTNEAEEETGDFGPIVKKPKTSFTNDIWKTSGDLTQEIKLLDEHQNSAFDVAIDNEISVITGYAGTGKSLTIKNISHSLQEESWKVSRVAPTGRAAQIIRGSTIHSWLEPIVEERPGGRFVIKGFNKDKMEEKECLIIDEFSMVDDELWNEITRVWKNSSDLKEKKIILVGDPGQLEPVGEGKPFIEILDNKIYPVTRLKKIHRNAENSGIISMASFIRERGKLDIFNKYPNIFFISKEEALQKIINDPTIQLITPRRKGTTGSIEINNEIKRMMKIEGKPDFHTLVWDDDIQRYVTSADVHLNDKVIVVRNTWEWNITNGTIGIYLGRTKMRLYNHVNRKFSALREVFIFKNPDTGKEFYLPSNKNTKSRLELAYAITIHKSQGSEYNKLILYLPNDRIYKKMLYTAVTRAKKDLLIYSGNKN